MKVLGAVKNSQMTMGQYWLSPNKLNPKCKLERFQKVAMEFLL